MARRRRKYIPLKEKLAAALACLLPQGERDALRSAKVPCQSVLKLFNFDHVALHALAGSDKWHNLTPMQVRPHREKSRRDTSIVAKVKRLREAPEVAAGQKQKTKGEHRGAGKRTTGAPRSSWGIPGLRRKVSGEVVHR